MAEQKLDEMGVRSVMEDPSAQAIAQTYADALLDAAGGSAESVLEELVSFVDDVLLKVPGLREVFDSLVIGRDEKIRLIDRVIAPRASEIVTNFLRVLTRHGRLELLPAILPEAQVRYERRQGRRRVQVISARPLDSQAEGRIRARLDRNVTVRAHSRDPCRPVVDRRNRDSGRRYRIRQFARHARQAAVRALEAEESP